jgi:hypothetical protein
MFESKRVDFKQGNEELRRNRTRAAYKILGRGICEAASSFIVSGFFVERHRRWRGQICTRNDCSERKAKPCFARNTQNFAACVRFFLLQAFLG